MIPVDPDTNCYKLFVGFIKHGLRNFLRLIVQLKCFEYQKAEENYIVWQPIWK